MPVAAGVSVLDNKKSTAAGLCPFFIVSLEILYPSFGTVFIADTELLFTDGKIQQYTII
jgi:hypothetical protein